MIGKLKIKRSETPGKTPSQLDKGEIAANVADGFVYIGTSDDEVVEISGVSSLDTLFTLGEIIQKLRNDIEDHKRVKEGFLRLVKDENFLAKIKKLDGEGSGINADKVDNFHASQTPQANQIPVLNSDGQLSLPFNQTPILVNGQDMMLRNFFVDAENGDDNNDGSSSAPFKTINKACDSVFSGGYGMIYLSAGQTFYIDTSIALYNKVILIYGDSSNNPRIVFDTYNDSNYNYIRGIFPSNGRISIQDCILENADKKDPSLPWAVNDWSNPIVPKHNGRVELYYCTINQTNKYFISTQTGFGNILLSGCNVNFSDDAIALVDSSSGNCAFSLYDSTATTGYKWVDGTIGSNVITHISSLDT